MTIYGFFKNEKLVYIGQTILKIEYRIQKHFGSARLGKFQNMPIIRAIAKYGKESFKWKILATCNSLEELNNLECSLISKYSPRYNIQPGGKNSKLAESTKRKISIIQQKKILCVDDQICFLSVLEAEAYYKAGKGTIGRVAAGKRNTYRGKKFEFINNNIPMVISAGIN